MRCAIAIKNSAKGFSPYVPDLSGYAATGLKIQATKTTICEAIEYHPDVLQSGNIAIPEASSHVDYVEVAA